MSAVTVASSSFHFCQLQLPRKHLWLRVDSTTLGKRHRAPQDDTVPSRGGVGVPSSRPPPGPFPAIRTFFSILPAWRTYQRLSVTKNSTATIKKHTAIPMKRASFIFESQSAVVA